jgi:hypothetical protein
VRLSHRRLAAIVAGGFVCGAISAAGPPGVIPLSTATPVPSAAVGGTMIGANTAPPSGPTRGNASVPIGPRATPAPTAQSTRIGTSPTPAPTPHATAPPPTPAPPAPSRPTLSLGWGVAEPDWPSSAGGLVAAESAASRRANLVETYAHWSGGWATFADWQPEVAATIRRGSEPVITWMSDDVDLQSIAAGGSDAYARSWADGLRAVGAPVLLRFDPEMNGNWMPYSPGYGGSGTTAAQFVAAWRHLHDIFNAEGASNVSWVWSPNIEYPGSAPLRPLYPGDGYVTWVALDGYNWGTTYGHVWQTFSQVFNGSIAAVEGLTSRPLMIAETGSAEQGGSKPAWIADMFHQLAGRHDVRGFIWFDFNKETDWRIASSPASAAAFAAGLAGFVTL